MLFIGSMLVICPLIFSVKQFYQPLGKDSFQVPQQYDVILAMIVYPALITFFGVLTLNFACFP